MLQDVKRFAKGDLTVASDRFLEYREWVSSELPNANYQSHSGTDLKRRARALRTVDDIVEEYDFGDEPLCEPLWVKAQRNGRRVIKAYDPLFAVNQACMKLRARISRMRRKWWGYTRKVENLQLHLMIFLALHNGYKLRY